MKISHIVSKAGDQEVLTHFLHLKNEVINILEIVSITWHSSTDNKSAMLNTTDGMGHLISDEEDIKGLKQFFQRV